MKKVTLLLFFLFTPSLVVQASWLERIKEELLPTGKYLEPAIILEIPALSSQGNSGRFEFKYTGEYKVVMELIQTEQNEPPRTVPPAEFILTGKMELIDDNGRLLFSENFKTTFKNIHVGTRLATFNVGAKKLAGEKIFKIQFQEIPPDWGRYFSNTIIYIQRNMKYGILR